MICSFLTATWWNASFSTGFCFYIHYPVSKSAGSKYRWFLSTLRLCLLSFLVSYNWWHQCLIVLCRLDETSKFSHSPHEKEFVVGVWLLEARLLNCLLQALPTNFCWVIADVCCVDDYPLPCLLIVRKVLCSLTQKQSTFCCWKRKVATKLKSRG